MIDSVLNFSISSLQNRKNMENMIDHVSYTGAMVA